MLHGRWTEENRAVLEEMLARRYPHSPVAVLDWDNTCIYGDIGDATFHALAENLQFDFESAWFWEWMEQSQQVERIREAYQAYRRADSVESRRRLRYTLEWVRGWMFAELDDVESCSWDSGAFVGWTLQTVREYVRKVIKNELSRPLEVETLSSEPDPALTISRGIRLRPEMRELAREMRRAGWQVWVISASTRWEVEAFAEYFGISAGRVLGMRRAVDGKGWITSQVLPPLPFDAGKIGAYQEYVSRGQPPWFAAGDSDADWPLLDFSTGVRLLAHPQKATLIDYSRWRAGLGERWLIQEFPELEPVHLTGP